MSFISRLKIALIFALAAVLALPMAAHFDQLKAQNTPLIPRATVFSLLGGTAGNPQLSPDGMSIAYIQASSIGVPNVWVRTIGKTDDRAITADQKSGIQQYQWSSDGRFILYLQDSDGDENFHLFSVELKSGRVRDLTPIKGVKAQNLQTRLLRPKVALIGLNIRDKGIFDMYRVDLDTGARELEVQNPGDVRWWLPDENLEIRAAVSIDPETSDQTLRVRDGRDKPWRDLIVWPFGESGVVEGYGSQLAIAFSRDGRSLFVQSALHSDTTQFLKVDLATGQERLIAQHPKANLWNVMDITLYDFAQVLFDPRTGEPQAVAFEYLKPEWKVLDAAVADDFAFLQSDKDAVPIVFNRSADDKTWLVGKIYDDRPMRCCLYHRAARSLDQVFPDPPGLEKWTWAKTTAVLIPSRDGFELPSYLTLPPGVAPSKLPLVLAVHGGPWTHVGWGLDGLAQWLASRGYAVLNVNFRGSDGYGKKFMNAGNGQWGVGGMQNDLTDAVKWAVSKGYADPARVGIFGGSYGGYAVLAGLTFTPDVYACGVDICGISNVQTMFKSFPDFWKPLKKRWLRRVGDAETDDVLNRRISPFYHVDAIRAPLLIGHGLNDPRVKLAESEQIVAAMRKKNLPVTFVVYPDEGHGFGRPQNNMDFFGRIEEFLAQYLGGRCEPWTKIEGSSAQLR